MASYNADIELLGLSTIAAGLQHLLHCSGGPVADSVCNDGGAGRDNCNSDQCLCWGPRKESGYLVNYSR